MLIIVLIFESNLSDIDFFVFEIWMHEGLL